MGEEFLQYGHLANGSVYASANFDTPSYESNLLEGLATATWKTLFHKLLPAIYRLLLHESSPQHIIGDGVCET